MTCAKSENRGYRVNKIQVSGQPVPGTFCHSKKIYLEESWFLKGIEPYPEWSSLGDFLCRVFSQFSLFFHVLFSINKINLFLYIKEGNIFLGKTISIGYTSGSIEAATVFPFIKYSWVQITTPSLEEKNCND